MKKKCFFAIFLIYSQCTVQKSASCFLYFQLTCIMICQLYIENCTIMCELHYSTPLCLQKNFEITFFLPFHQSRVQFVILRGKNQVILAYLHTMVQSNLKRCKCCLKNPRWGSQVTAETCYQLTLHSGSDLTDHLSAVAVKNFQKNFQKFFFNF